MRGKRSLIGFLWIGVMLSFLLPVWGQLASSLVIREVKVRHVGPPAASDQFILAHIASKVGSPYNPNQVDEDVRSLYATGRFYNIQVLREPVKGGIRLVYVLQGKPTVTRIEFKGNTKFSDKKLLSLISTKVGDPLDERKLFEDAQKIKELYQKKGYRETKVRYVPVVDAQTGRGSVTFEITEAKKVKIRDVQFIGAHAFSQKRLRKVIKTRKRWFLSWLTGSGILKEDQLEEDKFRLADFYREAGYIDFELQNVQIEQVEPGWIVVKFYIHEGNQYRVGSVQFEGNKLFSDEELRTKVRPDLGKGRRGHGLSMGPGKIFTPSGLRRDRQAIEDLYGARGYIDVKVRPELIPNTAEGTIDIIYHIQEGTQSYIELIKIQGNTRTKDRVIRRELAVYPGEVFDMVRVRVSTNRLYGLDYFSRVEATPEPTEVPNRKNLVITVEEKTTGEVRFGAGFSSIDKLVGFVELTQGNADIFKPPLFLGTGAGQKLRLIAQIGTVRKDFIFTFIEPWFLDRKLALGIDLYYRDLRFYSDIYDVQRVGARLSLTKALWTENWQGTVSYAVESIGLVNMPHPYLRDPSDPNSWYDPVPSLIRKDEGHTLISKIGLSLAYDTRNTPLLPNRGQRTVFRTELAGGPLGGDADFYRLELNSSHYFKGLLPGHIIEVIGRIGVVNNYGSSDHVPLFERYFLGGLYSLRGYKYRSVGPYDIERDEPLGGETFWFGSIEYSIPIIERIRFALFYDIGNVYPKAFSFSTPGPDYGAYTDNWGVGLRLLIPGLGPLRLDYAIPITHDPYVSGGSRFQFSAGYTRSY